MHPLGGVWGGAPKERHYAKASGIEQAGAVDRLADMGQFFFCDEKLGGRVPRLCAAGHTLHHWLRAFMPGVFQAAEKRYGGDTERRGALGCFALWRLYAANPWADGYHAGQECLFDGHLLHRGTFPVLDGHQKKTGCLQLPGGGAVPWRHWAGLPDRRSFHRHGGCADDGGRHCICRPYGGGGPGEPR